MEYLSKERYDEIADELKHLINDVYPKVKDDLAEPCACESKALRWIENSDGLIKSIHTFFPENLLYLCRIPLY